MKIKTLFPNKKYSRRSFFLKFKVIYLVILVIVITSLIVITAAYALWTERLRVNAYVATGDFSMGYKYCKAFSCPHCHHVCTSSCEIKSHDLIDVKFNKTYPKWRGYVIAIAENEGTVPVVIDKDDIDIEKTGRLARYIKVKKIVLLKIPSLKGLNNIIRGCGANLTGVKKVVLDPGEKLLIFIKMKLKSRAPEDSVGYVKVKIKAKLYNG